MATFSCRLSLWSLTLCALLVVSPVFAASNSGDESEDRQPTPGPGSEESDPLLALPLPLLRPPEGLDFVSEAPASRAAAHLARVAAGLPPFFFLQTQQ